MFDFQSWQIWEYNPTLKKLFKILWVLGAILIAGLYIHAYLFAPINTDAGFYLSMTDQWFNGAVIYKDLQMNYTPLGIYLFGLCDIWTNSPRYDDYLLVLYIFNILNAGWIYLLSRKLGLTTFISAGASLVSLGLYYKYEATLIVLEPFMLFFLLAATYFSLFATRSDRLWLFVGFFVSFAFLCKQYSLVIVPPMIYWMYKLGGFRFVWRLGLFFLTGFSLPVMIFLGHYALTYEIYPTEIMRIWFSSGGYGARSLLQMSLSLLLFITISLPILLISPLTFSSQKPTIGLKAGSEKVFLVWLCVSMALPLFFQQYDHYMLLLIPFGVLLGAYILKYVGKYQKLIQIALVINLLIFGGRMFRSAYRVIAQSNDLRAEQFDQAEALMKEVPKGSQVLLLSYYHQRLNYLCHYKPVLPQTLGYGFPENLEDKQLEDAFRAAEIIITEDYDLVQYPRYREMLEKFGFGRETVVKGLQIWNKRAKQAKIF